MMEEMLPQKLPTKELSSFEQGVLAGQQIMYDTIKQRVEVQEPNTEKDR